MPAGDGQEAEDLCRRGASLRAAPAAGALGDVAAQVGHLLLLTSSTALHNQRWITFISPALDAFWGKVLSVSQA